nr:hypothetical protein CFP56_03813 [Quercus suber]
MTERFKAVLRHLKASTPGPAFEVGIGSIDCKSRSKCVRGSDGGGLQRKIEVKKSSVRRGRRKNMSSEGGEAEETGIVKRKLVKWNPGLTYLGTSSSDRRVSIAARRAGLRCLGRVALHVAEEIAALDRVMLEYRSGFLETRYHVVDRTAPTQLVRWKSQSSVEHAIYVSRSVHEGYVSSRSVYRAAVMQLPRCHYRATASLASNDTPAAATPVDWSEQPVLY